MYIKKVKIKQLKLNKMFVVRDTNHPEADIKRDWSSFLGGFCDELAGSEFSTIEEAEEAEIKLYGHVEHEYRFHPAYNAFVQVDYEGLGAFELQAETLEEALIEADEYESDLAVCTESGDGQFYGEEVISFHKVREGRYIFELED